MEEEEVISEGMYLLGRIAVALEIIAENTATAIASAEQLGQWEPTATEVQIDDSE